MDFREEEALLLREIAEEVEEEGELYEADFAEREAAYHTQLAEWRTHRKLRVREGRGGRDGEGGTGRERVASFPS